MTKARNKKELEAARKEGVEERNATDQAERLYAADAEAALRIPARRAIAMGRGAIASLK
jgi:hypothetical protein